MRMFIVALASLVVNVVFWVKYRGLEYLNTPFLYDRDVQKDLILFTCSAYLLLEAVFLIWKTRRASKFASEESGIDEAIEQQFEDLLIQREQFQAEIQKAREELAFLNRRVQTLTVERDEVRNALGDAPTWSPTPTSAPHAREVNPTATAVPLTRGMRL